MIDHEIDCFPVSELAGDYRCGHKDTKSESISSGFQEGEKDRFKYGVTVGYKQCTQDIPRVVVVPLLVLVLLYCLWVLYVDTVEYKQCTQDIIRFVVVPLLDLVLFYCLRVLYVEFRDSKRNALAEA